MVIFALAESIFIVTFSNMGRNAFMAVDYGLLMRAEVLSYSMEDRLISDLLTLIMSR